MQEDPTYIPGSTPLAIPSYLTNNIDAVAWAREFKREFTANPTALVSVETLITWFANAIQVGRRAGERDAMQRLAVSYDTFVDTQNCIVEICRIFGVDLGTVKDVPAAASNEKICAALRALFSQSQHETLLLNEYRTTLTELSRILGLEPNTLTPLKTVHMLSLVATLKDNHSYMESKLRDLDHAYENTQKRLLEILSNLKALEAKLM
jgi:hypothetical protein